MVEDIFIRYYVGHCAVCGFPIFDMGNSDEMEHDFIYDWLWPLGHESDWFFRAFRNREDLDI